MKGYKREYGKRSKEITVGEVTFQLPVPPLRKEIANHGMKKRQQKFYRTERPKNWGSMSKDERMDFIYEEWNRREQGYWFFNNGEPTYITGTHYFFLNYWQPNNEPLEYRYTDREFFLLWDYILHNQQIHGLLYIKRRREGASTKAGCINYDMVSQYKNVKSGIQSMEEGHAQMLFTEMIVNPFVRLATLAPFFKPRHSGKVRPKDMINFIIPPDTMTKKKLKENASEMDEWGDTSFGRDDASLESQITFGPANEKKYDGWQLFFYWADEIGKTGGKINVDRRHEVCKHSVEKNDQIVGKMLYTSTVEEMEKDGAKHCKQMWDDSSITDVDEYTGQTRSGLLRYFNPAYRGYKIDEYGNDKILPDGRVEGRVILEAKRQQLREAGNRKKLNAFMRKFPFTINEAFLPEAHECLFDSLKIDERQLEITDLEALGAAPYVRGNLSWKGGVSPRGDQRDLKPEVVWEPDPEGRFQLSRKFRIDDKNDVEWSNEMEKWMPASTHKKIAGVDPYDYSKTTNASTESKGAGVVLTRYNPLEEEESGRFVICYKERPNTNKDFYEDMIKMVVFCGCEAVIEKNKLRCLDYFYDRGFGAFVAGKLKMGPNERRKRDRIETKGGEFTTISKKQAMAEVIETYVFYFCHMIDFPDILEEYRIVSIEEANKFDLFIATGLALLGNIHAKKRIISKQQQVYNLVQTYQL